MKRITATVLFMLMLVSSAMAQSLFPVLDTASQSEKELAPSYGVMADVAPVETGVDPKEGMKGNYLVYEGVSIEDYYAYGTYLGEMGYQLVNQVKESDRVELVLAKEDISFTVIYNPTYRTMAEVYPYNVEYEKYDPLKGYTELGKNTTVKLGSTVKMSIVDAVQFNDREGKRPCMLVDMQNLTQSEARCTELMNVKLHAFAGSNHYTFNVKQAGPLERSGIIVYQTMASLKKDTIYFVFNAYMDDLVALDPDRLAATFEVGNSKYVYTFYTK